MSRGDSRLSITVQKNTATLRFNRESRFIIDDYDSPSPLAYRMTKPYKLGGSFGERGVLRFVLTECNTEDDDNLELHIADYYTYFPEEKASVVEEISEHPTQAQNERSVWI